MRALVFIVQHIPLSTLRSTKGLVLQSCAGISFNVEKESPSVAKAAQGLHARVLECRPWGLCLLIPCGPHFSFSPRQGLTM